MNVAEFYPEPRICVVCGRHISKVATGTFAVDKDLEVLCIPCALATESQLRELGLWGGENRFAWYQSNGEPAVMSE